MDWQDILLSFLLSGVIGVILKAAVEAGFQQEISRVQNQNSRDLAILNAELQRIQTLETTRFADLHHRRAVAMLDLYRLLVPAEERLEYAGLEVPRIVGETEQRSPWDRVLASTKHLDDSIDPLITFYKLNKILLSPSQAQLMDSIVGIFQALRSSVFRRAFTREYQRPVEAERDELEKELQARLSQAAAEFRNVYPGLKTELENDFRKTLGFGIEENAILAPPA